MAQAATTLSDLRTTALAVRPSEQATEVGFYNGPSYALLRDIAKDFASSDIVPQRFQGKPANCMIAVNMAVRMQADPLMVMQNLYIVYGTPSWSAQFLVSCFNQCGRFDPIQYEFFGKEGTDEWGCRAFAISRSNGARVEGSKITIGIAKQEGWYDRKDKNGAYCSKWRTMPEQMLRYRAASWMIRACAPEIGMGFQTREEVADTYDLEKTADGHFEISLEEMKAEALPAADGAFPAVETPASVEKAHKGSGSKPQTATSQPDQPAAKPEAEPSAAAPKAGLTHDPQTGEMYGPGNGNMITCPNNNKQVDERDCAGKSCRDGCQQFM